MGIVFALCCLCFTAVNDLIFKFYSRKSRTRGLYVMIIGLVWMLMMLAFMNFNFSEWKITLLWGIISGVFSVSANLLLIEAMTYQEASVCSTVYRLNLVAVVIGAFLFFGENISLVKLAGVLLAVAAVLFFAGSKGGGMHSLTQRRLGFAMVLAAALLRAGMGLSYKYAFLSGADANGITFINSFCWIAGGFSYLVLREKDAHILNRKPWFYGLASGILVCGIVFFMALSLRLGDASVVLPIAQMSFLGTAFMGVAVLKESLSGHKILGLAAGLFCILLLSLS